MTADAETPAPSDFSALVRLIQESDDAWEPPPRQATRRRPRIETAAPEVVTRALPPQLLQRRWL